MSPGRFQTESKTPEHFHVPPPLIKARGFMKKNEGK